MKKSPLMVMVLLLVVFCLTSCKKLAIIKAPGDVEQEEFTTTFPFELRQGLIVMEVNLKGNIYEFVLDTGGFNLLDEKLAEELGIKGKKTIDIGDSQGNKKETPILKLDEIEIAGINFLETGTGIVKFDGLNEVSCLELQGMIGANLMQNAIWELDYQKQEITIAHSMAAFDIPANQQSIAFTTDILVSPKITVSVDGDQEEEVEIDLGSTGGFKLAKSTFDKLTSNQTAKGNGLFSSGLYGYGSPETMNFAIINQLALGDLELSDQLVTFKPAGTSTIGNDFLRNYRVIFNWFDTEIFLIPVTNPSISSLENYGFKPIFKDNKPQIGFIYNNSSSDKVGLKITDQILEVEGMDTQNITKEDWCEILSSFNQMTNETIYIKVLRGTERLSFELDRIKLL